MPMSADTIAEIQAKATIAAGLIQAGGSGAYDMAGVYTYRADPGRSIQLANLTIAVDMIYQAISNAK